MKILHVVQNYYPSLGGTQWLFQNLSEQLVQNYGDEVTVFTTDSYYGPQRTQFKKIELKEEMYNGVRIVRFPFIRWHFPLLNLVIKSYNKLGWKVPDMIKHLRYGPISKSLKKAMLQEEFDVICASSYFYNFMTYPLFRKQGSKPKPFVFMGAMHLFGQVKKDDLLKKTIQAVKASEFYIANTTYEVEVLKTYGVETSLMQVVGCGVDMDKFKTANGVFIKEKLGMKDGIVFGYFGRHDKSKGIDILIDAFKTVALADTSIQLMIAGARSTYTSEIEDNIQKLPENVKQRVFLLTNISEAEKVHVYDCFDVFVSPSTHESFGIVFLEAWSCRKPIIGADVGAVRAVISNHEDGLLMQPHDAASLAAMMQHLIVQPSVRTEMGNKGYEKVSNSYTWTIITEKYRDVYMKAIEKFNKH